MPWSSNIARMQYLSVISAFTISTTNDRKSNDHKSYLSMATGLMLAIEELFATCPNTLKQLEEHSFIASESTRAY